jgi:uncharacterized lipoprotein YddW (UPF0748 family)
MDVVDRYDLDGIHMDDYFYPYKEYGNGAPFPDDESYAKYQSKGGILEKNDWRRFSVDTFIESVYKGIKERKPWVKFGLSPFGIWRPGNPPQIQGMDAHDVLFADAKKWLENGWVDYFTPQLYWGIEKQEQSYVALLTWWLAQSTQKRPIWPGLATYRIGNNFATDEILWQIRIARGLAGASGHVHFSEKSLRKRDIQDMLTKGVYGEAAIIPAMAHLAPNRAAVPAPPANLLLTGDTLTWTVGEGGETPAFWWLVRVRQGGTWKSAGIFPVSKSSITFSRKPEMVAITAIDRFGGASGLALQRL